MDLAREDGITNLMILTVNGPMDQLIAAIEQNPEEINRKDQEGRTALTYAYAQNPAAVDLLRTHGADEIEDNYGHAPFEYDPWFVDQEKIRQAIGPDGQIKNLNDLFDVEWFGKGDESEVFLATSKTTGKKYIFKALKPEVDPDREIYFLKQVKYHPSFVHYYGDFTVLQDQLPIQDLDDFKEREEVPVIVLEYLEGKPLLTLGLQPIEEIASIAKQLVAAIQYLHQQGMADADLHANNVMYLNNHVVKIIDLGLACAEEGTYSCHKMYPNAKRLYLDFIFGAHNVTSFDIIKEVDLIRVAQLIEDLFPGFHDPWEDKVYSGEFRVEVEDPFFRQLLKKVLTLDYMDRITLDEFYHRLFRQYP